MPGGGGWTVEPAVYLPAWRGGELEDTVRRRERTPGPETPASAVWAGVRGAVRVAFLCTVLALAVLVISALAGTASAGAQEAPGAPGAPAPAAAPNEAAQGVQPSITGDVLDPPAGEGGDPAGDTGGDSGGGKKASCDDSGAGKSFAGGMLTPGEDFDTSFTRCPLENYYLQYVDFTNWTGVLNPGRGLNAAPKQALNSIASIVFELNAKLIYYVIAILNYAMAFNLLDELGKPAEQIMSALGEGFFKVWLPAMYGLAILWGAWLSLWRNQVAEGFAGILKAALIGAFGVWLVIPGNASWAVQQYNGVTGALTNTAFCAVSQVDPENRQDPAPDCSADGTAISQDIWDRYVLDPWARLQISDSNQQKANDHAEEILALADSNERETELKSLGNSDEEIKSTVDFIYASKHLTGAMLMLVMSAFFTLLIASVSILLLISEVIVLILILTSPVWLLPAVYPGSTLTVKVLLWFAEETVQIVGYKLLLGVFLVLVQLIFASGFGIGTVFLLCIVLSLVCFRFRHDLRRFFQPRGIVNGLRDRYDRNRELRRDQSALGGSTGGLTPAGSAAGGAGALPGGQARRPQQASNIRQSVSQARAGGFMPDAVGAAAGGLARRSAVEAYDGGREAVGTLREENHAPIAAARRLESLASRRAENPESLSDAERRELENAERMVDAGKDPTSRIRPGARRNQRAARDEFKRRHADGMSAGEQLAGPRLPGESEAEYRARQREARDGAAGSRQKIQDLAADPDHQRGLGPFGERPGPKKTHEDGSGNDSDEGSENESRHCGRCGAAFSPTTPGQTLCSKCEDRDSGGPDEDDTKNCHRCGASFVTQSPAETLCPRCKDPDPGGGSGGDGRTNSRSGFDAAASGGRSAERPGPLKTNPDQPGTEDQQAKRPVVTGESRSDGPGDGRAEGSVDGKAGGSEEGAQAKRPDGVRPPVDVPEGAEYDPESGRIRGLVQPGERPPEAPPGYSGFLEAAATQDGGGATYYTWEPDKPPKADVETGENNQPGNPPNGAASGGGDLHPREQARRPESNQTKTDPPPSDAPQTDEPGFLSAERVRERMRAGDEVREAQQRGMREGAARGAVRGGTTGGPEGAVAGAGAGLVGGGLAEGGKAYKDNVGRMWTGKPPSGGNPAGSTAAGPTDTPTDTPADTPTARRPESRPTTPAEGGATNKGRSGAGNFARAAAGQAKQQAQDTGRKAARNVEEVTRAARDELEKQETQEVPQARRPQTRPSRERMPLREPKRNGGDRSDGSRDETGGR